MKKQTEITIVSIVLSSLFCISASADRLPNVVFILADDLGVNDISLHGSQFHETPNIDALAERGMMFNQAYAANPLCSPTRASIMTGLAPSRIGILWPHCHNDEVVLEKRMETSAPPARKTLNPITLTRLAAGYYTLAESFKQKGYATAHFGKWHLGAEPYSPLEQGFDVDIPHTPAPSPLPAGFFYPFPVWENHGKPGDNLEDLVADEAVKYIHEHKDKPFFLNYWAFQVHSPWQAKKKQIDKYRAKAQADSPQRNPVYAGMIETLDEVVGRLVEALNDAGILDNTLIVFTSDNGPYIKPNTAHMPEEFHGVPVSSAHPLRGGKGTIYEGGTRVPLIIVWPDKVTPGARNDQAIVASQDFFPTFVELLDLPTEPGQRFDGVSIAPVLAGEILDRELYCRFSTSTSVRQGNWKLIRNHCQAEDQSDSFELYNLKDDIGEANNLASAMPNKVKALGKLIDAWLANTESAIPVPNPAHKTSTSL